MVLSFTLNLFIAQKDNWTNFDDFHKIYSEHLILRLRTDMQIKISFYWWINCCSSYFVLFVSQCWLFRKIHVNYHGYYLFKDAVSCATEHSIKHSSDRLLCQFQSRAKFPTPYFVTKDRFAFWFFESYFVVFSLFDINKFLMPVSSALFHCKDYFFRRNSPYVFVYSMTITNWAEIWEWFSIKGSLYIKQRYVRRNGEHGEGKLQSEICEQEANRERESIQERREPFDRWIYSLSNMSLQTTTRACNVNTKYDGQILIWVIFNDIPWLAPRRLKLYQ